jgi:hypothetical protein
MMATFMTSTCRTTLIELLLPRANPWLRNFAIRQGDPPSMVRIIRFGSDDEDAGEDVASNESLCPVNSHND